MAEPVRRSHYIANASPAEVYAVVSDFAAYPRLFPEIKKARIWETQGNRVRAEFHAQAAIVAVRYVLDLVCDPGHPSIIWTFVEGDLVSNSEGSWFFAPEAGGTRLDYQASLDLSAPLPAFLLRKILDALLALSLPSMFEAVARETLARQKKV